MPEPETPEPRTFGTNESPVKVPIRSDIQAVLFQTDQTEMQPGVALSLTSEWMAGEVTDNFALTTAQAIAMRDALNKMIVQLTGHQS